MCIRDRVISGISGLGTKIQEAEDGIGKLQAGIQKADSAYEMCIRDSPHYSTSIHRASMYNISNIDVVVKNYFIVHNHLYRRLNVIPQSYLWNICFACWLITAR